MTTHPATPDQSNPVGKTPEALRLAEALGEYAKALPAYGFTTTTLDGAAAELRRLYALSAAAPAAPADLITIRKPTTRAEVEWLAKLAHLLVSDVNDTLQRVLDGAPQAQQPSAAQAEQPSHPTRNMDSAAGVPADKQRVNGFVDFMLTNCTNPELHAHEEQAIRDMVRNLQEWRNGKHDDYVRGLGGEKPGWAALAGGCHCVGTGVGSVAAGGAVAPQAQAGGWGTNHG